MQTNLDDFKTGWYGISLGLSDLEIDDMITALQDLKEHKTHFQFRSNFEGKGGIGDIEIYYQPHNRNDKLVIEMSTGVQEISSPIEKSEP